MMLLHHVTWSVNSICHMFGKQPATQKDHSTNFAPLGIISFGEAWHNFHHAFPRSARHGALPHQVDPGGGADPRCSSGPAGPPTCAGRPRRNSRSAGPTSRMCFSPGADVIVGGIVVVVGVDALRHVREPKQIPLASLPLLFGLHQLDEAFVWWGLQGQVSESVGARRRLGLPVVRVRGAAGPRSRRGARGRAIGRSAPGDRRVRRARYRGRCRARRRDVPRFGRRGDRRPPHRVRRECVDPGRELTALYVVAACGAFLACSHRDLAVLGALNLVAVPVLMWMTVSGFISLWCFWAAIVSVVIDVHLRRTSARVRHRARERNVSACAFSWSEPVESERRSHARLRNPKCSSTSSSPTSTWRGRAAAVERCADARFVAHALDASIRPRSPSSPSRTGRCRASTRATRDSILRYSQPRSTPGCHYIDMAMTLSEPHPERPYEEPGVMLGAAQFAASDRDGRSGGCSRSSGWGGAGPLRRLRPLRRRPPVLGDRRDRRARRQRPRHRRLRLRADVLGVDDDRGVPEPAARVGARPRLGSRPRRSPSRRRSCSPRASVRSSA